MVYASMVAATERRGSWNSHDLLSFHRPCSVDGIEISGVDELPSVIATTECSACGRVHEWTKDDAWLAEGGEHYRRIAADKTAVKSANGHPKGAI
jgi:hypothetical protein